MSRAFTPCNNGTYQLIPGFKRTIEISEGGSNSGGGSYAGSKTLTIDNTQPISDTNAHLLQNCCGYAIVTNNDFGDMDGEWGTYTNASGDTSPWIIGIDDIKVTWVNLDSTSSDPTDGTTTDYNNHMPGELFSELMLACDWDGYTYLYIPLNGGTASYTSVVTVDNPPPVGEATANYSGSVTISS